MFTTSPIAVTSPPARMAPTSASPVFTPMRIWRSCSTFSRHLGERLLHLERGADGPLGVVLVRGGGAEQGDDAVAEDLVDLAAEVPMSAARRSKQPVDQVLHVLGIEPLGQRGEARRGRRTRR